MPDKFEVLYSVDVDDPIAVEYCVRGLLHKYRYWNNKDYYDVSLKEVKNIFNGCKNLIETEVFCYNCDESCKQIGGDNDLYIICDSKTSVYSSETDNESMSSKLTEDKCYTYK